MSDPILEEIWRVREVLLKKHGGLDGYFKYVQQLDRQRRRQMKKSVRTKSKHPWPSTHDNSRWSPQ